jgi:superfamily II DNA or RNA helicase
MKTLTKATQALLAPLRLHDEDRVHLALDRDGLHFDARIFSVNEFSRFASLAARRTFPLRIPERKELTGRQDEWLFAATDTTASIIDVIWPKLSVEFEDDETKLIYEYLLTMIAAYDRNIETVAKYHAHKELPGRPYLHVEWECNGDNTIAPNLSVHYEPTMTLHEDRPLSGYQQVATACAIRSEGYGLFMDTGTGKTPCVIATVCNEAPTVRTKEERMYRALIVCPRAVRTNWVDEFERFSTVHGKVTVLRGDQIGRIKLLIDALHSTNGDDYSVVIVSYETMTRMLETLKAITWDLIALDESQCIKWPTTKRSQAAMVLRESARKRMCLTATPIANTPLDIYSQFEFLGKGFSGFMSWKNFRSFYGVFEKTQHGDKLVALQNLPFMQERLARYSFIIRKEEALPDLPKKVYDVLETSMTDIQAKIYEEVRHDLVAKLESELNEAEDKSLVINNVLTQLLRLAQIASGFITWDGSFDEEGNVVTKKQIDFFAPNNKIEALVQALKEKPADEKSIVWSCWVPNIKQIMERLLAEGIYAVPFYGGVKDCDRDNMIRAFNEDRDCKVLVGNPACGGVGLNLLGYPPDQANEYGTDATQVFVMSQDWSMIKRTQCEDRNYRRGTRRQVRITDVCIPGTIDDEIRRRVTKKRITAWQISDVREILRAVLKGVISDE